VRCSTGKVEMMYREHRPTGPLQAAVLCNNWVGASKLQRVPTVPCPPWAGGRAQRRAAAIPFWQGRPPHPKEEAATPPWDPYPAGQERKAAVCNRPRKEGGLYTACILACILPERSGRLVHRQSSDRGRVMASPIRPVAVGGIPLWHLP
jgi:hypothetical protein